MGKSEKNSKPIKNRKVFENVLTIVLIVFTVIAFAVSGVIFYQRKILSSFWVNGQSMYPTLNKDITDLNGNEYGIGGGGVHGEGAKNVDYGVYDSHDAAKKNIKRFDIVICPYNSGDESDKIKRVLGLPGETIKFDTSLSEDRGQLSVKQKNGEYKVVDQPIDKQYINSAAAYYPSGEITLGEKEYFVAGDNRAHSSDCRGNGSGWFPINYDLIVGKVIAIVGKCEAHLNNNGEYEISNIHYDFWPRFL